MPGLARPVLLRRREYHAILRGLLDDAGATFADLVVVGDIFELDLAMPLALGARVGLVASAHTPAYECAFVEPPRGRLIDDLAGSQSSRSASRRRLPPCRRSSCPARSPAR